MKTSEQTNEISAALSKAQGEITNPAKDAQNPHFRSFYADLASGINAIRTTLAKNGLAYLQATRLDGEILMVDTRLCHVSGQWVESEFPACRFPAKPQEVGSALTYARRYALFALVGIAGEDDDGEAANKTETPARKPVEPVKVVPKQEPEESKKVYDILAGTLMMAETVEQIDGWVSKNLKAIETLNDDHKALLRKAIKDLRGEYQKAAA